MQSTRRRDLKIKVNQRIDELDEMTTRKWGSGAVPEVSLDYGLKGHVGGRANYLKEEIQINYYLLDKYEDDYIHQTIGHEYAHLQGLWSLYIRQATWQGLEVCDALLGHGTKALSQLRDESGTQNTYSFL
mgnify:CR=1 FL=1